MRISSAVQLLVRLVTSSVQPPPSRVKSQYAGMGLFPVGLMVYTPSWNSMPSAFAICCRWRQENPTEDEINKIPLHFSVALVESMVIGNKFIYDKMCCGFNARPFGRIYGTFGNWKSKRDSPFSMFHRLLNVSPDQRLAKVWNVRRKTNLKVDFKKYILSNLSKCI